MSDEGNRDKETEVLVVLEETPLSPEMEKVAEQFWRGAFPSRALDARRPVTDRARSALRLAREEARLMGHECVYPEHLFLGPVHAGGVAGAVLGRLGVQIEATRSNLQSLLPPGNPTVELGKPRPPLL